MAVTFSKATKKQAKLRLALIGPSGSGKTYSALAIASAMGGRIALIDTEHGSASKYADLFSFDCLELDNFSPETYIEAIAAAEAAGYDTLIIDSLSHAWSGKGGILEFVDKAREASGDAFGSGWRKATPKHNALVDRMLAAHLHVIATMRSKTEYVVEKLANGKSSIRKVGMQPVQREGVEFEFDVVGDLDQDNTLTITKSRCPALSGQVIDKAGAQIAGILSTWLGDGAPVPPPAPRPQPAPVAAPVKPTQPAAAPATPTNGTRPYPPEKLQEAFAKIVRMNKDTPMAEGIRGLVVSWLELCFAGQNDVEQKRRSLVRYLTGKASIADCTWAELRAFRMWLKPTQDSGNAFHIDDMAEQEAQQVITRVLLDAGQQELPLAEEPAEDEVDADGLPSLFTGQGGK